MRTLTIDISDQAVLDLVAIKRALCESWKAEAVSDSAAFVTALSCFVAGNWSLADIAPPAEGRRH